MIQTRDAYQIPDVSPEFEQIARRALCKTICIDSSHRHLQMINSQSLSYLYIDEVLTNLRQDPILVKSRTFRLANLNLKQFENGDSAVHRIFASGEQGVIFLYNIA